MFSVIDQETRQTSMFAQQFPRSFEKVLIRKVLVA